jgi:fluoroacetyl-CoA thioesterase
MDDRASLPSHHKPPSIIVFSIMLQPGDTGEASFITTDRDMAKSLSVAPDDDFPEVFATSRMIALMELAGARLMKPTLEPNQ